MGQMKLLVAVLAVCAGLNVDQYNNELICQDTRNTPGFAPACEGAFTEARHSFLQTAPTTSTFDSAVSAGLSAWQEADGACVSSDTPMGDWIVLNSTSGLLRMYAVGIDVNGNAKELMPILNTTVASSTAVLSVAGFYNLGTAKTQPANTKEQNFPTKTRTKTQGLAAQAMEYTWSDGRCHITSTYGKKSVQLTGSTSSLSIKFGKMTVCKKRTNCADSTAQSTRIEQPARAVQAARAQVHNVQEFGTAQRKLLNADTSTQSTCCIVKKILVSCMVGTSKCTDSSGQDRDSLQTIAMGLV